MNGAIWLSSRQGKPAEGSEVRKGLNESEWGEGFLEGAEVFFSSSVGEATWFITYKMHMTAEQQEWNHFITFNEF